MPRLQLCLLKYDSSTSNKNDNNEQLDSIDNENESMDSDVE